MMAVELKKVSPLLLRDAGLNEKWLQDRIAEDPTLLGLGELGIVTREHSQPAGGRVDFLMRDSEGETFYEVELMLGSLDESHIIRTIEYWDIERQRRPSYDHRAVIVAEQITTRFFNVLRLLNRAVPLIAIKLSAFKMNEGEIVLHPVIVLDVIEEIAEEDSLPAEPSDRAHWERNVGASSLKTMDSIVAELKKEGVEPRLTFNRHHIAMGTTGYNFCWFHPRKSAGLCYIDLRAASDTRDSLITDLQNNGMGPTAKGRGIIGFSVNSSDIEDTSRLKSIIDVIRKAEEMRG
jgi:hypothetical protein